MNHHDTPLSPGLPGIAGMELQAASGHLAGEPAIFILQPHTLQVHDAQDQVEIPDGLEFLVRRAGGQQLTTTSLSTPRHTPGWSAELRLPEGALVIRFPDASHLYDGSLPSGPAWQRAVADSGDVVIVTGPMADVDCIDPAIQAGLTTYLRVPLSIVGMAPTTPQHGTPALPRPTTAPASARSILPHETHGQRCCVQQVERRVLTLTGDSYRTHQRRKLLNKDNATGRR